MGEPWFRRWALIGYWPIHRKGWITLSATAAVFIPCGLLFVTSDSAAKWVWGGIAFAAAALCNGLAARHMERHWS